MFISFKQSDYLFSYNSFRPQKLAMHLHKYYEFLYVLSCDGNYIVEGNTYTAGNGDLFITKPNELHTITFNTNKMYERYFIQISKDFINSSGIDMLSLIDSKENGTYNKISADIVRQYGIGNYFRLIEPYVVNRVPESDILIKSYVVQMLAKINSAIRESENTLQYSGSDNKIDNIKNYLDENIMRDISLDELAQHFYINKYYMCHSFKERTGLTVKQYIAERRIAKAKYMITNGGNITDICFDCGFTDYSVFYKTFKKMTSKSPREFFKNILPDESNIDLKNGKF